MAGIELCKFTHGLGLYIPILPRAIRISQTDCLCNLGSGFQKQPLSRVGFEWKDNGFHQIYNIKCWNNFEEVLANLSKNKSFFYVILLYDRGIEWIVARKSAEQNLLHFWLLVLCFLIHAYILYCILFTSFNLYVLLKNSLLPVSAI